MFYEPKAKKQYVTPFPQKKKIKKKKKIQDILSIKAQKWQSKNFSLKKKMFQRWVYQIASVNLFVKYE